MFFTEACQAFFAAGSGLDRPGDGLKGYPFCKAYIDDGFIVDDQNACRMHALLLDRLTVAVEWIRRSENAIRGPYRGCCNLESKSLEMNGLKNLRSGGSISCFERSVRIGVWLSNVLCSRFQGVSRFRSFCVQDAEWIWMTGTSGLYLGEPTDLEVVSDKGLEAMK